MTPDVLREEEVPELGAQLVVQWLVWSEGLWPELVAAFCGVQCLLSDRHSHRDHGTRRCYRHRLFFVPRAKCLFADLRICWKHWAWSFCGKTGKFLKCPWSISFKTGTRSCCIAVRQAQFNSWCEKACSYTMCAPRPGSGLSAGAWHKEQVEYLIVILHLFCTCPLSDRCTEGT